VKKIVIQSYCVAFLWCIVCSIYVFLYGVCGSVEEKSEADGGGYECSGNGQDSGITRQWFASFIVFALVAIFFVSPLKIFFTKVILPNYALSEMEEEGMHVGGDRTVLDLEAFSAEKQLAAAKQTKKFII
jgi:hypothetical protein